jgi:hypothetical protein
MSFGDFDQLTPSHLIAQYVLECRGVGQALPYTDYEIIEEWLAAAATADDLLLVLSDILPEFFSGEKKRSKPRSLKGARKKVLRKLKESSALR